ncbi:MAG TPA: FAD/NAD(P)-binding oxidoreductase, partial [Polyangia bacterium]|nr:FAD/NAD(P)-binding oxidoreductase [Polyangia bacterium]
GVAAADRALAEARAAGAEVRALSTAIAWYPEDAPRDGQPPGLLAVTTPDGLLKLTADRYVYATGGYDQNLLFANNDRPGVFSARAVGRLLARFGVKPAERPIVVGDSPYAVSLQRALTETGAEVTLLDGKTELVAAHGHSWVRWLEVRDGDRTRKLKCDLVAVAAPPAPASELPRQHGVEVVLRPDAGGFACVARDDGSTAAPNVWVSGDVAGYLGPRAAAEAGARTGDAIARSF